MDDQLPPHFTITAYDAEPAQRSSLLGWLPIGCWLVAAALALASAWARVMQLSTSLPGIDGTAGGEYFRFSFDGWGRPTFESNDPSAFQMTSGSNFGVLLCAAAAVLVLAAALDSLPRRYRWQPSGRIVSALAATFLLAVVLCEVVTNLPYRHSFDNSSDALHFGLAPWLGGAGCLVAALGCLLRRSASGSVTDDPVADPENALRDSDALLRSEYALPVE